MNEIIEAIRSSCHCGERRAGQYLDDEIRHQQKLRDRGEIRYAGLETACYGLGLEYDYTEYFIAALSVN